MASPCKYHITLIGTYILRLALAASPVFKRGTVKIYVSGNVRLAGLMLFKANRAM